MKLVAALFLFSSALLLIAGVVVGQGVGQGDYRGGQVDYRGVNNQQGDPRGPQCDLNRVQQMQQEAASMSFSWSNLDDWCNKLRDLISAMQNYASDCQGQQQGQAPGQPGRPQQQVDVLSGIRNVSRSMCEDPSFRQQYRNFADCLERAGGRVQDCSRGLQSLPPPQPQQPPYYSNANTQICCQYLQATKCMRNGIMQMCGSQAGDFFQEMAKRSQSHILKAQCQDLNQLRCANEDTDMNRHDGHGYQPGGGGYGDRNNYDNRPYNDRNNNNNYDNRNSYDNRPPPPGGKRNAGFRPDVPGLVLILAATLPLAYLLY